jgi:hypothetical protein
MTLVGSNSEPSLKQTEAGGKLSLPPANSLTLKMKEICSSEISENICRTIQYHIPEESNLHSRQHKNLEFEI